MNNPQRTDNRLKLATLDFMGNVYGETLVDLFQYRVQAQADQTAYIFLKNGELDPTPLTYGELGEQVRTIAPQLSYSRGERALLVYPYESGLSFITAFYACLYAGVIAVPCHPPRNRQDFTDLQARITSAQAKLILTDSSLLSKLKTNLPDPSLQWLTLDSFSPADSFLPPPIDSDTLAFLQYTSGSTGVPKGVKVTHGCIRSNQKMLEVAFGSNAQTINVGWLPLFHDMGLMGNVLQPLYLGIPSILMSPIAFVQKPFRWLQAMSHYQATTSGAPNFAYDLLCRHTTPEQRQSLNLSHWELAFSGAEPIRVETMARFAEMFADRGFRREAFYPCYGMAEATLFITGGVKTELPKILELDESALKENRVVIGKGRSLVGCGRAWLDTEIQIVDPQTQMPCGENKIGEIWVAGSGVGQGYWNSSAESDRTFRAQVPGCERFFLRTGDLGFLQDQELFMTGRLKEILVFWGFNHYPQHIEHTVEHCHPALRSNGGAAFAVRVAGEERLVIAQEVERNYRHCLDVAAVVEAVRWAVFEQHFVDVYAIAFLQPGGIPKTSSGKIQRQVCQEQFLAGQLKLVAEWRSSPDSDVTLLLKKYLNPIIHAQRYLRLMRGNIKKWLYSLLKI
jgi:acyl-CoA synthetase (AMP-forming)/AMP-acid ligase II